MSKGKTIWTAEEVKRFLAVAKEHRLYALNYVLLTTGLRCGEELAIRWDDVQVGAIGASRSVETWSEADVESHPKSASS